MFAAVLCRQLREKAESGFRRSDAELNGTNDCPVVKAANSLKVAGLQLGLISVGKEEENVGTHSQRRRQSSHVVRRAVRKNAAYKAPRQSLAWLVAEHHRRRRP